MAYVIIHDHPSMICINIYIYIHQGKSRWHSYHVLVYICPVLTHLLGTVPCTLTMGYISNMSTARWMQAIPTPSPVRIISRTQLLGFVHRRALLAGSIPTFWLTEPTYLQVIQEFRNINSWLRVVFLASSFRCMVWKFSGKTWRGWLIVGQVAKSIQKRGFEWNEVQCMESKILFLYSECNVIYI